VSLPILYSFRRCPYAIRARLALLHCGARVELREVVLKDKPSHMLEVSSDGTVPVLVLPNSSVIHESIDIMRWAMNDNPARHGQNSKQWLSHETMNTDEVNALIFQNDEEFKSQLDKYKYSDRHPEHSQDYYLQQALPFLEKLDNILSQSPYLTGNQFRFADAAILPFIRQFSLVDPKRFDELPLPKLQHWLTNALASELFLSVMDKFPPWKADSGEDLVVFGA